MTHPRPLLLSAALFLISVFAVPSAAQSRDHLTPQEADLVRDAQVLDQRIEVFVKATDRRMMVLTGAVAANSKQLKKDAEKWGELPTGSRAELLADIARILDEAIDKIDDVSLRDEKNPLIPKALRKLTAQVTRLSEQLLPLREQAKSQEEIAAFEAIAEHAESILEAGQKLPPPGDKKAKARN